MFLIASVELAVAQDFPNEADLKWQVYGAKYPWDHIRPYGDLCPPKAVNQDSQTSTNLEIPKDYKESASLPADLASVLENTARETEQKINHPISQSPHSETPNQKCKMPQVNTATIEVKSTPTKPAMF
jgi:hypothetical protein